VPRETDFTNEFTDIKKLLIALLIAQGVSATAIGKMLGVSKARIGQLVPVRRIATESKK